jgi:uncharacterized membrane protein SpoIIM required for sporulation
VSAEEFIRYLSTFVALAGLATLATTMGSMFGLWAAALTLFLPGAAIGVPLWLRHFDAVAEGRTEPKASAMPSRGELKH